MIKVCNAYCGIGGNRKLWPNDIQVTAIENNPDIAKIYQDFFPNDKVIVTDGHQYLLEHYKEYDFIWSSPPCPTHSKLVKVQESKGNKLRYPAMELYQEIILLNNFMPSGGKYCIENVKPYYIPLVGPQEIDRHLFWSNFYISKYKIKNKINIANANGKELQKYLNIYVDKKIYINNSHDPYQILRNCVNPKLGLHIWNCCYKNKQLDLLEVI